MRSTRAPITPSTRATSWDIFIEPVHEDAFQLPIDGWTRRSGPCRVSKALRSYEGSDAPRPKPLEIQELSDDNLIDFTPELRAEAREIIKHYKRVRCSTR